MRSPFHRARIVTALCVMMSCALIAVGCGDDDSGEATTTPAATATAPGTGVTSGQTGNGNSGSAGSSADSGGELCGPNDGPGGLDHTVVDLPADDPDGGLVVHAAAGASTPKTGLLTSGTTVVTVNDPARCLVTADGGVWWEVSYDNDASRGWVNARFLTRTGTQETASREEMCRLYREVLAYRNGPGEFAPQALTAQLGAELSGPPPGISEALGRISNPRDEADLALAYESLTGYVGPLCP